ncbi:hypothetical protein FRC12_023209 [Ceratobasidium sp. 428]|nr:hypothetical protein FRC12_023209 [Ceratobasidium sp. 428]
MADILKAVPVAVSGLGGVALLWSFRDGRAGNLMFDGASIFLYACALFVYVYSVIPSLIQLSEPLPPATAAFPKIAKESTLAVASSHLVCSVALTGVLLLQAARYWVESPDGEGEEWGSEDVPAPEIRPSRRHSAGEQAERPARSLSGSPASRRKDGSLRRKTRK